MPAAADVDNRSDPRIRSTPFDEMIGREAEDDEHQLNRGDPRRISDLSEMDYLA